MAWTFAARADAVPGSGVLGVRCQGRPVALYRLEGEYFATSDVCPHQGGPLSEGCVVDGFIECPVHYALFDIRTGAADGSLTTTRLRIFPARVENEEIHVDLDA